MTSARPLQCPECGAAREDALHGDSCARCGAEWPVFEA